MHFDLNKPNIRKDGFPLKKICFLCLTAMLLLSSIPVCSAPSYSDSVAPLLAELKIIQGDPDGNLRLSDSVSRAECAKIAVAASSYRDMVAAGSKTSPFRDTPANHWAAPYITVAVKNGLCKGYLDATFRPSNTVLYEEALTMFLRILGYSEADFGSSWPDGQIGIAKNIGLCDSLSKSRGETLTRRDMMILVYNLLNTPAKGAQQDFLSDFDRTITDDVVLIATNRENAAVGINKVLTSVGTFHITEQFDNANVGKRGSIVLRNGDTLVAFLPETDTSSEYEDVKTHVVYSLLGDSVITYQNGTYDKVDFTAGTTVYEGGTKTTFGAISSKFAMGDLLKVKCNPNGTVDYVVYEEGTIEGPITVTGAGWHDAFGVSSDTASVMRDGERVSHSDVKRNDIAYYAKDLNLFFVYSKKVTGIYESATPNQNTPATVTVSGTTYNIEGVDAFTKLSAGGSFHFGDTVTLLLGKDGDIADVLTQSQMEEEVVGYLIETERKDKTANGSTVAKPYVKLILPSGDAVEYVTAKEYESMLNQAVRVSFLDGVANVSLASANPKVSGKFSWNNSARSLGSFKLANDLEIIEVSTTNQNEAGNAANVFPARLDGMNISASKILYAKTNADGKISALILEDCTEDMHAYGIVTSAKKNTFGMSLSGSYTYFVNGIEKSLMTNGSVFSVSTGQPVQIKQSANGSVTAMKALSETASGTIRDLTGAYITVNGASYRLSDNVSIYTKNSSNQYTSLSKDELANTSDRYTVRLYSEKQASAGGRVRIIIAQPK